eukprot:1336979-Pleurochrysis_carterae.AAC.2
MHQLICSESERSLELWHPAALAAPASSRIAEPLPAQSNATSLHHAQSRLRASRLPSRTHARRTRPLRSRSARAL